MKDYGLDTRVNNGRLQYGQGVPRASWTYKRIRYGQDVLRAACTHGCLQHDCSTTTTADYRTTTADYWTTTVRPGRVSRLLDLRTATIRPGRTSSCLYPQMTTARLQHDYRTTTGRLQYSQGVFRAYWNQNDYGTVRACSEPS